MQKTATPGPTPYQLETAQLDWDQEEVPSASNFGDIYYSRQHGLDESRYVFLQNNQLAHRWQQLNNKQLFTIAETGFGTGLNFLASWQLWQQCANPASRLLFISTEKHPLKQEDLKRALAPWQELEPLSRQLIQKYPSLIPGSHLLHFDEGRINLLLLLGDAQESLEQLRHHSEPSDNHQSPFAIDAWFLDGFSPAKNPQLWQPELFQIMADLSSNKSTLTTFTAAGDVRRGLEASGFEVTKVKGYGHKREMLTAVFSKKLCPPVLEQKKASSHYKKTNNAQQTPWFLHQPQPISGQHIAIIGAGLAGCNSAYAMAKRGWKVSLIERLPQIAAGASGNPQGMLYTKLSPIAATLNQFTLSSYLYALRFYQQYFQGNGDFCGVLQLARSKKEQQLMQQLKSVFESHPELVQFLNPEQASDIAGVTINSSGWLFPNAGWLSPPKICHILSQHPNITIHRNQAVLALNYQDRQWILTDNKQFTVQADAIIIANSNDALQFTQSAQLPLKSIRGQMSSLSESAVHGELKTVICHEGYITPSIEGCHSLGATYDINTQNIEITQADHLQNLQNLDQALPSLLKEDPATLSSNIHGRAALRCASPDYLPLVGPVPIRAQFINDYAPLRKNANYFIDKMGNYYPNLFINTAHGSRGLTSTPLCSELLASTISNEPPPLPRKLVNALNPARFIIRDLIRNKL